MSKEWNAFKGKGLEPELCEVSKGKSAFMGKKGLEPELCEVSKGKSAFMGNKGLEPELCEVSQGYTDNLSQQ